MITKRKSKGIKKTIHETIRFFLKTSFKKISNDYFHDRKKLDVILKEFVILSKNMEKVQIEEEVDSEIKEERDRFEKDFVAINCEIQNLRSENEALIDEIKAKEDNSKKLDDEITEKDKLINYFKDKVGDLK